MHNLYDYKKFAILYVDDEELSLKYFTREFEKHFRIFTASNARDGFKILQEHRDEIGILMTDQRMPGEKGVQLLERARQTAPRVIRMLATAFSDLDAAIGAVNSGAIYKYVTKPWEVPELETTLKRALEFFTVQRERDHLLREKLSVLHNMMITDRVVSLGLLAAGLGHHMRNGLVAIRTFLDLAPEKLEEENVDLERLRNPEFWNEFYVKVQGQLKKITSLLYELDITSKASPAIFSDHVNMAELLHAAMAKVAPEFERRRISVIESVSADLPKLLVDRPKFERLIELLLRDEMLSMPAEGGRLEISARAVPASAPSEIEMTWQDNGSGVPGEALRSLFDPFFTRAGDPQELGINLMACYFIVYHHGGRVTVERTKDGTMIRLNLPLNPQARTSEEDEKDFLPQVLMNEALWEKLLSGS